MTFHQDNFLGSVAGASQIEQALADLEDKAFFKDGSKSMEGPINMSNNTIITALNVDFNEIAVGPTPPAGQLSVYAKTNNKLFIKDSGGTETELASGGDVDGPASAVDSNLASYDGITGKIIKDSGIATADIISGPMSSVDENLCRFDGVTGRIIEDTGIASADVVTASSNYGATDQLVLSTGANKATKSAGITVNGTNDMSNIHSISLIETGGSPVQEHTIQAASALVSNFTWTTPAANPGATSVLNITTGGQLGYSANNVTSGGSGSTNVLPLFDGSGGILLKSSILTIDNDGNFSKPTGLFLHEIGTRNFGVGTGASNSITSGTDNTAVGNSLTLLTTADRCTAMGVEALDECNADNNTAIGFQAGRNISSGSGNTSIGSQANISSETLGSASNCTFVGYLSGSNQNLRSGSTGIGVSALASCSDAQDVTAVGLNALRDLESLDNCTAVGVNSIILNEGKNCVAIGSYTLDNILTGEDNIAMGYLAGTSLTLNDSDNICIGNTGTVGDNQTIRVGNAQTSCFLAGVAGVTPGGSDVVMIMDPATDQMGTAVAVSTLGDVTGPGSSTDNAVAKFDSTTGKIIQNSSVTLSDDGELANVREIKWLEPSPGADTITFTTPGLSASYSLIWPDIAPSPEFVLAYDGANQLIWADRIISLASSTDNLLARWNGTTGRQLQESLISLDDSGDFSKSGSLFIHERGGIDNFCAGLLAGAALSASSTQNTLIGQSSGTALTGASAGSNTLIGNNCFEIATSGANNVAVGNVCCRGILTGSNNTVIGTGAGANYTSTESNNILLDNLGVVLDNNVIRIGNVTHTTAYIQGVAQVSVSNDELVTIDTSTGQLGSVQNIYPPNYIYNCGLAFNTTAIVNVKTGNVVDSVGVFNFVIPSPLTCTFSITGTAGGLQVAEASDTMYLIFVIGDTNGVNANNTWGVPQGTAISLPGTHDVFRLMGHVKNDASSNILNFVMHKRGTDRHYQYQEARSTLEVYDEGEPDGGTAGVFESLDLGTLIPANGVSMVDFSVEVDMDNDTDKFYMQSGINAQTTANSLVRLGGGIEAASGGFFDLMIYNQAINPTGGTSSQPSVEWGTSVIGQSTMISVSAYTQNL